MPTLAHEATAYLRNQWLTIEPRKQWPDGSRIPAHEQAEPARIIGVSGDGGWSQVAERERAGGEFGDDLVGALTEMTQGKAPDPRPTWVTCVPSLRSPDLVQSLASRFAEPRAAPLPSRRRQDPGHRTAIGDEQLRAAVRQHP